LSTSGTETEVSQGDLEIKDSLTIRGVGGPKSAATSVAWRAGAMADKTFELLGDYNDDGVIGTSPADVDSADYVTWRVQEGESGGVFSADGDDDGDVDDDDYDIWTDYFGNSLMLHSIA
jgi:hypothetical protein